MSVLILIRKCLPFLIFMLVAATVDCKAQNYVTVPNNTISIPVVLDLSVDPSPVLSFNFTTTSQIDAGIPISQTLTYRSNKDWYITIQGAGNGSNFSGGDPANPMPLAMLKYKLSTTGTWIGSPTLSNTAQPLTGTVASKIPRGTGTIVVDFLMDPKYSSYPAQDYSVTITYTIQNQ